MKKILLIIFANLFSIVWFPPVILIGLVLYYLAYCFTYVDNLFENAKIKNK